MKNEESLNEDLKFFEKMIHVDVKADVKQQEIKGLVAESYNFLKELS